MVASLLEPLKVASTISTTLVHQGGPHSESQWIASLKLRWTTQVELRLNLLQRLAERRVPCEAWSMHRSSRIG